MSQRQIGKYCKTSKKGKQITCFHSFPKGPKEMHIFHTEICETKKIEPFQKKKPKT